MGLWDRVASTVCRVLPLCGVESDLGGAAVDRGSESQSSQRSRVRQAPGLLRRRFTVLAEDEFRQQPTKLRVLLLADPLGVAGFDPREDHSRILLLGAPAFGDCDQLSSPILRVRAALYIPKRLKFIDEPEDVLLRLSAELGESGQSFVGVGQMPKNDAVAGPQFGMAGVGQFGEQFCLHRMQQ
jgi:hypothetical protein